MNTWRSRVSMLLLFLVALSVHGFAMGSLPNTPLGMFAFHTSAAFVDLALLASSPQLLKGKLLDDTQNLCLCSIAVNFAGWMLYMAYAPPYFYNDAQYFLCAVQWGRLFISDNGRFADYLGFGSVPRHFDGRQKLHFRKKNQ